MNNMNNIIKPILKQQLLIIGFGMALYFLVVHFFGFLIGFMANTFFLVGAIFYIRRRDSSIHRSNLVNYRRAVNIGRSPSDKTTRLRYVCLLCGTEAKDAQCSECGSKIRKPIF